MHKLLCAEIIGLAATSFAGENNTNSNSLLQFSNPRVSIESGYNNRNVVNGIGYIGNAATMGASVGASNVLVNPTASVNYLYRNENESETHLTFGLDKNVDVYGVNATLFANYVFHDVSVNPATTGLKDSSECNVGAIYNNCPYVTPSVKGYFNPDLDDSGVAFSVEKGFSWKQITLTPAAQYGIGHVTDWWSVGGTVKYTAINGHLTPYASLQLIDNNISNGYRAVRDEIVFSAGVKLTF